MSGMDTAPRTACMPWLKFECPYCNAAVGVKCYTTNNHAFAIVCPARLRLVPARIADSQLRSRRDFSLIKGRRYSARCQENRHEMCSRAIRTGHGYRLACQCQCHGDPIAYLPDRPKKAVNPLESTKCQKGKHQECKKVRRLPNNLYASCECACHGS